MRKTFLLALAFAGLTACEESLQIPEHQIFAQKLNATVYHLKDGRYCYYASNNNINSWMWLIQHNSYNGTSCNYYVGAPLLGNTIRPNGYDWHCMINSDMNMIEPTKQEIIDIISTATKPGAEPSMFKIDIVISKNGFPLTDRDGNLIDPDRVSPNNTLLR